MCHSDGISEVQNASRTVNSENFSIEVDCSHRLYVL